VTATDTAVVSILEIVVLPAVLNPPPALLPAPALQQTLPVTGADLMRWTTAGLALIAGGSLLRRRRES
jgi:LPXTG-motif cell wall-anchored protein